MFSAKQITEVCLKFSTFPLVHVLHSSVIFETNFAYLLADRWTNHECKFVELPIYKSVKHWIRFSIPHFVIQYFTEFNSVFHWRQFSISLVEFSASRNWMQYATEVTSVVHWIRSMSKLTIIVTYTVVSTHVTEIECGELLTQLQWSIERNSVAHWIKSSELLNRIQWHTEINSRKMHISWTRHKSVDCWIQFTEILSIFSETHNRVELFTEINQDITALVESNAADFVSCISAECKRFCSFEHMSLMYTFVTRHIIIS